MAERQQQASRLTPVLNTYLQSWSEYQNYLDASNPKRPAEEVSGAKHALVEYINPQLRRLNFAIDYKNQPTLLMANKNDGHIRGFFLLMAQGKKKPVASASYMTDLLAKAAGGLDGSPGFKLVEAAIRRESLSGWRKRIQEQGSSGPQGPGM